MSYQSNVAYDFDRPVRSYDPAPTQLRQPPELKVVESRKNKEREAFGRTALMFLVVLIIFAAMLYNRVVLTELTSEISTLTSQYQSLKDEYQRMQVELEGRLSTRAIEDGASAMGMAQIESYQIQYVDLGDESGVVMSRESTETLSDRIISVVRQVKEYLGL